jgi:hypothetical protein
VEACTSPRAGGQSGYHLARPGQAQGFNSPTHNARPAPRTGDSAPGTAHHRVQIHDGEGGIGVIRTGLRRSNRSEVQSTKAGAARRVEAADRT